MLDCHDCYLRDSKCSQSLDDADVARVVDPYSFLRIRIRIQSLMLEANTDPDPNLDPDPNPIRIQGLNDQKFKKKLQLKNFFFFFGSKTAIYLSLGLHKVYPSYRRSLQLSKEAIQHFKTWTFTNFFLLLWVIFSLLNPDPDSEYGSGFGSTDPIEYGSNTDPDPDPQPWMWLTQSKAFSMSKLTSWRLLWL